MKICGTVLRPLARSIIVLPHLPVAVTSISWKLTPLRVSSSFAQWQ